MVTTGPALQGTMVITKSNDDDILIHVTPEPSRDRRRSTVCPKSQVKIYLLITGARKHSITLERWHFLH